MKNNLSLRGVHLLVESSDYFQSFSRPTWKDKIIDRINFVCNQIILGNMMLHEDIKDYEAVGISSKSLRYVLGERNMRPTLNEMVHLGILEEINKSYCSSAFSNQIKSKYKKICEPSCIKYGFTDKAKQMGLTMVNFRSSIVEQKVRQLKRAKLEKYLDNPIYKRIMENLFQLQFNGDMDLIEGFEEETHKKKVYKSYIERLVKMNEFDSLPSIEELLDLNAFRFSVSHKVNRVFHFYAQVPKEYRKLLKHKDGSELWEVDLTSSQPTLIALSFIEDFINGYKKKYNPYFEMIGFADQYLVDIYALNPKWESDVSTNDILNLKHTPSTYSDYLDKQWTSTNTSANDSDIEVFYSSIKDKGINKADFQILQDILDGKFYQRVAEQAKREGDIEFYNLFIDKEKYTDLKQKILGNGLYNRLIPIHYIMPAEKYLCQLYPTFMWWLRNKKFENGYKYIASEAMKLEADIFINKNYTDLLPQYFAVPIHDSIICKEEHVEFFKNRIVGIIQETFGEYFPTELFKSKMLKSVKCSPDE